MRHYRRHANTNWCIVSESESKKLIYTRVRILLQATTIYRSSPVLKWRHVRTHKKIALWILHCSYFPKLLTGIKFQSLEFFFVWGSFWEKKKFPRKKFCWINRSVDFFNQTEAAIGPNTSSKSLELWIVLMLWPLLV